MKSVIVRVGVTLIGVCAAALSAPPTAAQESDKLLAEVRAAWEKREKAAQNLTAKWSREELVAKGGVSWTMPALAKGEAHPAQDTKVSGHSWLYFAGTNCRIILDCPVWNWTHKRFNRAVNDSALKDGILKSRTEADGYPTQSGGIHKQDWNDRGGPNVWPLMASYRGTTGKAVDANINNYTSARRVQLMTGPGIELIRERTETRGHARLLVDPARDHLPTLYEDFRHGGDLVTPRALDLRVRQHLLYEDFRHGGDLVSRYIIRSRKDDRYGWVPESWDITHFNESKLNKTTSCRLQELTVGSSVPDELFDVTYPHGSFVQDTTGGKPRELITREGKEPREVLPGEWSAPFDQLIATEKGDLLPGGRPSIWRRYWWAGVGVLVLLAVLVWRVRRVRVVKSEGGV